MIAPNTPFPEIPAHMVDIISTYAKRSGRTYEKAALHLTRGNVERSEEDGGWRDSGVRGDPTGRDGRNGDLLDGRRSSPGYLAQRSRV